MTNSIFPFVVTKSPLKDYLESLRNGRCGISPTRMRSRSVVVVETVGVKVPGVLVTTCHPQCQSVSCQNVGRIIKRKCAQIICQSVHPSVRENHTPLGFIRLTHSHPSLSSHTILFVIVYGVLIFLLVTKYESALHHELNDDVHGKIPLGMMCCLGDEPESNFHVRTTMCSCSSSHQQR